MIEFISGIAIGAVFSPFWMKVWNLIKPKLLDIIENIPKNK